MLEHPDRDDPVELPGLFAIVGELELDVIGDAGIGGALVGGLDLLLAQVMPSTSTP